MDRKKTDLAQAIIHDQYTGESWLRLRYTSPLTGREESDGHRDAFVKRELDIALGYALTDAIVDGFVPVPPIQARRYDEDGQPPYAVERRTDERRVRVVASELLYPSYAGYGGSSGRLRVDFTREPLGNQPTDRWHHLWASYDPFREG